MEYSVNIILYDKVICARVCTLCYTIACYIDYGRMDSFYQVVNESTSNSLYVYIYITMFPCEILRLPIRKSGSGKCRGKAKTVVIS